MIDFSQFDSLFDMMQYFCDEETCRNAVAETRWGAGEEQDIVCPYCGRHHCHVRKDGRLRCNGCKRNFSCKVGTIFENSNLPLAKWFVAMYLISSHRKGISSCQLAEDLKITQKSAWYMLHKVRSLYGQTDGTGMDGTVECDEVYIGGKEKWKHKSMRTPQTQGRSTMTKTPVFGMMQRIERVNAFGETEYDSKVHAFVVARTDGDTLLPVVEQFVEEGTTVITDELSSYSRLAELGYRHEVVSHSLGEYAKDYVSTNSVEGFWSHIRRMIIGCYHNVSKEHLQSYVDEACFRWNTRKMDESFRFTQMFEKSIGLVKPYDDFKLCVAG